MAKNIIDIKNRTGKYFCLPAPILFCLSILAVLFDSNETEVNRFSSTKIVKLTELLNTHTEFVNSCLEVISLLQIPQFITGQKKKTAKMTDV